MRQTMLSLLTIGVLILHGAVRSTAAQERSADSLQLREQVGQMIVAGFRGYEPTAEAVQAVQELGVGGIIYFDRDVPTATNRRNIRSPQQLRALSDTLQRLAARAGRLPLLIAVDQEGGRVNRLKPTYGFPTSVSAAHQGQINQPDTTRYWAHRTARMCREAGINVDFAPCVDVNVNPHCPIIGALGRSFSTDTAVVTAQARLWVEALHNEGVLTSLKHFPGHGSSQNDSHLGLTDITRTWQRKRELAPYRTLLDEGYADFVMVGHLLHREVDADYPASLSRRWIHDILRGELGFRGVVITDDLNMGAIVEHYSLERALELAVNAGVDMIIIGNNGSEYEPDLTARTVDMLCSLVRQGRIPRERITEAYGRVLALKERLGTNSLQR